MKNRAKCKLCGSIIESFHNTDFVICKCGEIAVHGGDALKCIANDWSNFLRIDDAGNEIIVTVKDNVKPIDNGSNRLTKKELLLELEFMIKNIEELPQNAMTMPITHYDLVSALLLISALFRSLDDA